MESKYFKSNCLKHTVYRQVVLTDDFKCKYKEQLFFVNKRCWFPKEITKEVFEENTKDIEVKNIFCLGYNPAKSEKKIDKSNRLLIKELLKMNLNNYTLYNFYPDIIPKAKDVNTSEYNAEYKNWLIEELKKQDECIIFFGKLCEINENLEDILNSIDNKIVKFSSDASGLFKHPAYIKNSEFCLLDFKKDKFSIKDKHYTNE